MSEAKPLELHKTGPAWDASDLSPFCAKLELYLRATGIDYRPMPADMRRAPKGKIPWVRFADGEVMGDSQLIMERLERERPPGLDARLTAEERAVGHAVRRMLEEGTYFVSVHTRWCRSRTWPTTRSVFLERLPLMLRAALPLIRARVKSSIHAQGTGRHTVAEIDAMGVADLDALATLVGDGPFLFGASVTTFDCAVFGVLESVASFPGQSAIRDAYCARPALVRYRQRLRDGYFKDLPLPADLPELRPADG